MDSFEQTHATMRVCGRPYREIGTNRFGHHFLGYFKVVEQTVPRLAAGHGLVLADADFMP
jgi:hypothetical protein